MSFCKTSWSLLWPPQTQLSPVPPEYWCSPPHRSKIFRESLYLLLTCLSPHWLVLLVSRCECWTTICSMHIIQNPAIIHGMDSQGNVQEELPDGYRRRPSPPPTTSLLGMLKNMWFYILKSFFPQVFSSFFLLCLFLDQHRYQNQNKCEPVANRVT